MLKKKERKSFYFSRWKILKNMERNFTYLGILSKSLLAYNTFKYNFYRNKVKFASMYRLNNPSVLSFFKLKILNYLKTLHTFNFNFLFQRFLRINSIFTRYNRENLRTRRYNRQCLRFDQKRRFRHLTSEAKLLLLYNPYKETNYVNQIKSSSNLFQFYKSFLIINNEKVEFNNPLRAYTTITKDLDRNKTSSELLKLLKFYSACYKKLNKLRYYYKFKLNFLNDLSFNQSSRDCYYYGYSSLQSENKPVDYFKDNSYFRDYSCLFFDYYHKSKFGLNYYKYNYYNINYYAFFKKISKFNLRREWYLNRISDKTESKDLESMYNQDYFDYNYQDFDYLCVMRKLFKKRRIQKIGISNLFTVGNLYINVSFANKFWAYTKINLRYPSYFYITYKITQKRRFNLYYFNTNFNTLENTIVNNFYVFWLRFFSLYNKYFYFYIKNRPYKNSLFCKKYAKTKKIYFWS